MDALDRPVAYTIAPNSFQTGSLTGGEPFVVKQSANAWWMDRVKVYALLFAFRFGSNVKDACHFAGISLEQWKYFNEVHPDFYSIKQRISAVMAIKAGFVISEAIDKGNLKASLRWMAHDDPMRWGSAKERLFWAKKAFEHMEDEDMRALVKKNIQLARQEIEDGRCPIGIVDGEGHPLRRERCGHWVRKDIESCEVGK